MTGNNKVWRAPLAGLAAVAMLATMGVAAGTANAAGIKTVSVTFKSDATQVATVDYGASVNDAIASIVTANPTALESTQSGNRFVGFTGVTDFNAPLTGDVTLTPKFVPAADATAVTINYKQNGYTALDGQGDFQSTGTYVVYAEKNGTLSNQFIPTDLAGDGYVATAFDVARKTGSNTVTETVKASDWSTIGVKNADTITVTPNKAATTNSAKLAEFDFSAYPAVNVAGALADKQTKDRVLSVDVAADAEFATPTFSVDPTFAGAKIPTSWTRRDDDTKTVLAGATTKVSDNATFDASEEQAAGQVTFYNYDGSVFNSQQVLLNKSDENGNKNVYGTVVSFKDPERAGYIFLGWKRTDSEAKDTTKVYTMAELVRGDELVSKNGATFAAQFEQDTDSKITVTFRDATYKGSHDDVVVDVNVGKVWDGTGAPTWDDRDGYYFAGWSENANDGVTDGKPAHPYEFNELISSNQASFVLYAIYGQNDYDDVKNALQYVGTDEHIKTVDTNGQAVDGPKTNDDAKYFTDASFAEFKKVWDKVNNEYAEAQYKAQSNKIDAATSTNLVNELKAAWKDLRFTAENADTVLDGKDTKADATAKVVYRLSAGSSRHLLTGDEVEVKALTNKYVGQGGWTLDNTTFRTVSNYVPVLGTKGEITGYKVSHPEWVSGSDQNKAFGFDGLLLEVSRVYNGREHMYTSDQVEINALVSSGKWTKDSNLASFYVPAQYTTSTRIVRLYNKATGAHLFTSDKVEINYLTTQKGWVQESDLAGFYAL